MVEDATIEKIYAEVARLNNTRPDVVRKVHNTLCKTIKHQIGLGIKGKLETFKLIRVLHLGSFVPKPGKIGYYRLKSIKYERKKKKREICDAIALARGPEYYKTYIEHKKKKDRKEIRERHKREHYKDKMQ